MKTESLLEWIIAEFRKLQDPAYGEFIEQFAQTHDCEAKKLKAHRFLFLEGARQMVEFAINIGVIDNLPNQQQYAQIRAWGREKLKSALLDQKINPDDNEAADEVKVAKALWIAGKLLAVEMLDSDIGNAFMQANADVEDQEYAAICREVRGAYAQVKRLTQTLKNGPGL
ncbi:MAG: hypothetical protein ACOYK8_10465 [Alphaproteobacteria bacterium]